MTDMLSSVLEDISPLYPFNGQIYHPEPRHYRERVYAVCKMYYVIVFNQ